MAFKLSVVKDRQWRAWGVSPMSGFVVNDSKRMAFKLSVVKDRQRRAWGVSPMSGCTLLEQ